MQKQSCRHVHPHLLATKREEVCACFVSMLSRVGKGQGRWWVLKSTLFSCMVSEGKQHPCHTGDDGITDVGGAAETPLDQLEIQLAQRRAAEARAEAAMLVETIEERALEVIDICHAVQTPAIYCCCSPSRFVLQDTILVLLKHMHTSLWKLSTVCQNMPPDEVDS